MFQAHPYTIFSAAPSPKSLPDDQNHAWLHLLIRAQGGFTRTLLEYTKTHTQTNIRLDGPYGSSHALETLCSTPNAVVVAGGSGIAVAFPLLWALLSPPVDSLDPELARSLSKPPRAHLLWVVHAREHLSWLPAERLQELKTWGLDVVITAATAEAGRPDIKGYVNAWVKKTGSDFDSGVVVSGPDGMIRDVTNACADLVREGRDIKLVVEKFGW
jgi:NAD(P)H-flavin reductase